MELGVVVYGHWGPPLLGFPTSAGDEWELEGQGLIGSLAQLIDAGRVKFFSLNSVNWAGFYNKARILFIAATCNRSSIRTCARKWCRSSGTIANRRGSRFPRWAHRSARITRRILCFKHPDVIRRCFALSGVYDIRGFMSGMYDDNTYFNNPVDYLANLSDPWIFEQLAQCDIHIATGNGPWENSGPSYRLSKILADKGIGHSLDDWGAQGGHDWPFWKHQMWEYITRLF